MKKIIIALYIFLAFILLSACVLDDNIYVKKYELTPADKMFSDLGQKEDFVDSNFYEFSTNRHKSISVRLFKAKENLEGWEIINFIDMDIKDGDILNIALLKDKSQIQLKLLNGKSTIGWNLGINNPPKSYFATSLEYRQKIKITDNYKGILSFVLSDEENIGNISIGDIDKIKPVNKNHFIMTIKEAEN